MYCTYKDYYICDITKKNQYYNIICVCTRSFNLYNVEFNFNISVCSATYSEVHTNCDPYIQQTRQREGGREGKREGV